MAAPATFVAKQPPIYDHRIVSDVVLQLVKVIYPTVRSTPLRVLIMLHTLGIRVFSDELKRRCLSLISCGALSLSQYTQLIAAGVLDRSTNNLTSVRRQTTIVPPSKDFDSVPFSASPRWEAQQSFYACEGSDAWREGLVPSQISSNSLVARHLIDLCSAFASDRKLSEVTILELGSGHGALTFHIALHLSRMSAAAATAASSVRMKIVLSDCNEGLVRSHMQSASFRKLALDGMVDFAVVDGTETNQAKPIMLLHAGKPLAGSIFLVSNYLVDSLPCDVFRSTSDGGVFELREHTVTQCGENKRRRVDEETEKVAGCNSNEGAGGGGGGLVRVSPRKDIQLQPHSITPSSHYSDPVKGRILLGALQRGPGLHLLPFAFKQTIDRVRSACLLDGAGGLLAIAIGDMPFSWDESGLADDAIPEISPHHAALALQVDLDVCEAMFRESQEKRVTRLSSLEALSPFCSAIIVDGETHLYPQLVECFKQTCKFSSWIMEDVRSLIEEASPGSVTSLLEVDVLLQLLTATSYDFFFWFSVRWFVCRAAQQRRKPEDNSALGARSGLDQSKSRLLGDADIVDSCLRAVSNFCSLSLTSFEQSQTRLEVLRFFYVLGRCDVVLGLAGGEAQGSCEVEGEGQGGILKAARDTLPPLREALPVHATAEAHLLAKAMAR